ncbi:hypothetical protein [Streptomyces bullii]|uniref:Transposase n=1 Tax=Streptomyces bullii TaxID=349910 RepID=A0ABW0UVL7_9ACTN
MDFDTVADELYGLRPEDFTAARNVRAAEARTAGDRALAEKIAKLRRPSLSAWACNLLVREQPGEVEPLLRLGEGLRQAHRDLDGGQLRELSRRQHALITALARQARRLAAEAGHPVGEDVQQEVESTLHAVLADPDAAREWADGRLVKPLSAAVGFPTATEKAVPRRTPGPPPSSGRSAPAARSDAEAEERRREIARARQEVEEAQRELRDREEGAAAAHREAKDAQQLVERLQRRVDELTEELRRAREEQRQARTAERAARERARTADGRAAEAKRRADSATAQLPGLIAQDR